MPRLYSNIRVLRIMLIDVLKKYVTLGSTEEIFHAFALILLISSTLYQNPMWLSFYFILHEYPVLIVYWET